MQTLLLGVSWHQLFLISVAQSNVAIDWIEALLDAAAGRPRSMTSDDVKAMSSDASRVSAPVQRLRHLKLDVTEYTCLKAMLLFRPGNNSSRPSSSSSS